MKSLDPENVSTIYFSPSVSTPKRADCAQIGKVDLVYCGVDNPHHTMKTELNRDEYKSEMGLARRWSKDGLWHVARPSPQIVNGLRTGGYLYTDEEYKTREQAVAAIERGVAA